MAHLLGNLTGYGNNPFGIAVVDRLNGLFVEGEGCKKLVKILAVAIAAE